MNEHGYHPIPGKIFLVGAGPGAPDLLTMRAVHVLRRAQVVLYDRLVNPKILDLAPAWADRVYVGKKPDEPSPQRQLCIHQLMAGYAGKGKTVVRLKGGDPFVFGRGGEELRALHGLGFEVEVVPGISSCIAAPAAAGIPVTHRGVAASFGVFTGHLDSGPPTSSNFWDAAAGLDTVVFLMGVKSLPLIVSELLAQGKPPATPIALIEKATLSGQRVITGTLDTILTSKNLVIPPVTIVVGHVVDLREIPTPLDLPPEQTVSETFARAV